MVKRKGLFSVVLCMATLAWGQTVDVVVLQDGATAETLSAYNDCLLVGCLDRLFGSGAIVTNEKPAPGTRATFDDPAYGLAAAQEGFSDYLLVMLVFYTSANGDEKLQIPARVLWRITRVSDGRGIGSGTMAGPTDVDAAGERLDAAVAAMGAAIVDAGLGKLVTGFSQNP